MTLSEMSGASFSQDRKYRSLLWRRWEKSMPKLNLIMLNPSKAGAVESDPTVTRQIERAKRLGCGSLYVTNAFDLVATDPKDMKANAEPTREINDLAIQLTAEGCLASGGMVIAAWGPHAKHRDRHNELLKILAGVPLHALVVTKDGFPGHPLYIPYDRAPVRWP